MPREQHRPRQAEDGFEPRLDEGGESFPPQDRHPHSHDRRGHPRGPRGGEEGPDDRHSRGPRGPPPPWGFGPPLPWGFGPGRPDEFHILPSSDEEGHGRHRRHHRGSSRHGPPPPMFGMGYDPRFDGHFEDRHPHPHHHDRRGPHPWGVAAPYHGRFGPGRPGLHWIGIALLTIFVARCHGLIWFGLGALAAGKFMRHCEGRPGDAGAFGARWGGGRGQPWWAKWGRFEHGRRGGSWKFTLAQCTDDSSAEDESGPFVGNRVPRKACNCGGRAKEETVGANVKEEVVEESGVEATEEKKADVEVSSVDRRLEMIEATLADLHQSIARLSEPPRSRRSSVASSGVDVVVAPIEASKSA